jgi:transcriptional regulator with XRE-family HTH domain
MPPKTNSDSEKSNHLEVVLSTEETAGESPAEVLVGIKLNKLRSQRGLSLRALASLSRLNINTLSLIENGKSSPSVSTLQQLAQALEVPITAFFESEPTSKRVVFTSHRNRSSASFSNTRLENLGKDLAANAVQPFVVTLSPGTGSGDHMIVHTGHEFVYCLSGNVLYTIDEKTYMLEPGDSIVFESHLPHCWINNSDTESKIILVIYPADQHEEPGGRHFSL